MIVPFPTGNVMDAGARIVAQALSKRLNQQVIVENKPGAAGILGTAFAANAKPDGYTVLLGSSGPIASHVSLYKKLPYDPQRSFLPVNGVMGSPLLLVVNSSLPYKSFAEFIAHAKKNPGKITFGSTGIGAGPHLAAERLQAVTGIKTLHIPYKDASSLYPDLVSGRIDALFDYVPAILPYMKSGQVLALGVTTKDRLKVLPETPTLTELEADVVQTSWSAVLVPTGTPPNVVQKLSLAVKDALEAPEFVRFQQEFEQSTLGQLGPEALRQFIGTEIETYRAVIRNTGMTLD